MPWEIKSESGRYCVYKQSDGSRVACHDTMEEAKSHMAALYANEKSFGNDTLAFQGGAVKALGGGKVGGYLVLFSGPDDPDLQGDYFTKETRFFIRNGDPRPILYRHGVHPVIKDRELGRATLTVDDVGVFLEGELELRDKYEKAIYSLAEKGKLGWSSGSMNHLTYKNEKGKAKEIESWPIGEASLTPAPVEGRTAAYSIKELLNETELDFDQVIKDLEPKEIEQEFDIDGIPSIKSFCEAVSPASMKDGSQRSKAAVDATKEFITIGKVLGEAVHSYASRLVRRTENRFLKDGREIHPDTVQQNDQLLSDIEQVETAFQSVKEGLMGIRKISEMTVMEQKALDERARLEMWNFCRISGTTPEELDNVRTGTS